MLASTSSLAPAANCLRSTRAAVVPAAARRSVAVQAQQADASRRQVALSTIAAAGALLSSQAANAQLQLLGRGRDSGDTLAEYKKYTEETIKKVQEALDLDKTDPKKEEATKQPSFTNTYSALNALAGHYNNFGATTPLPKKRLERAQKELVDAEKFLSRDR
ncbi:hypothetical protein WJX84_001346 [Apatococcus fuscideae]|uniref:Photosystem II 11 kDa protein n=1 Tax=Apatococcus fuscideae TaxID=2026836 RepID=A0AAW1SWK1_9CHLO